jgi:hypothetical protein
MVAIWVILLTAILLPVATVLTLVTTFHKTAVDSIYRNVDDVSDSEMPTTITSFQSGPDVVSTIGGSGEGLNCSLPRWTNVFFDHSAEKDSRRHLVLQRFRQACVFHDLCYRHGLATYGYNQNDCDRVLQNAAFRLCLYIRNGTGPAASERCQTDSKLVLAGVSLGGADAYRAWGRSTYFEFEPDPWRSQDFSVSRVVAHPFKQVAPEKYRDDPDQVILAFRNIRSNLTVTCVTCKGTAFLQSAGNPNDVSPELRSVNIDKIPDEVLKNPDRRLSDTTPIWLPPRRRHAAPHLLIDSAGKHHLIWMSRNNSGDTNACIVVTDAARLLTTTLPKADFCSREADSPLSMVEIDMFASSPLPMEIPSRTGHSIFATAISAKNANRDLKFCSRAASRDIDRGIKGDDQANCTPFPDPTVADGKALGAFQNFAIIRPGQQILFARDTEPPGGAWWTSLWQNFFGIEYSPKGQMLLIDVAEPKSEKEPLISNIKKAVRFDIDDRLDPMLPITRTRGDLRFLSLQKTEDSVRLRLIDFARDNPKDGNVRLVTKDGDISLHSSWGFRPVLVLETRETNARTKLVFSRGEIAPGHGTPATPGFDTESLRLETLVFEREAAAPSDAPFVKTGGAACTVKYTFNVKLAEYPCYRRFDPERGMRASPAAHMQASQLLAGHFAGRDGHDIAFTDFCLPSEPIILKPDHGTFVPIVASVGDATDKTREVTCDPLDGNRDVSGPIRHRQM